MIYYLIYVGIELALYLAILKLIEENFMKGKALQKILLFIFALLLMSVFHNAEQRQILLSISKRKKGSYLPILHYNVHCNSLYGNFSSSCNPGSFYLVFKSRKYVNGIQERINVRY